MGRNISITTWGCVIWDSYSLFILVAINHYNNSNIQTKMEDIPKELEELRKEDEDLAYLLDLEEIESNIINKPKHKRRN